MRRSGPARPARADPASEAAAREAAEAAARAEEEAKQKRANQVAAASEAHENTHYGDKLGRIWVEGQDEKREIHVVTKHDLRLELARQVNAAYGTSSTKLLNSLRLRGPASRWYATSICDAHARTSLETAFTYFHTVRKYLTASSKLLNLPNTNELERLATLAYMFGYSMVATRRPSYSLWDIQSVSIWFKPNACKRSETFYHRYDIDRGPTAAYAIDLDSPTIVANGFLIQR